MEGNIYDFVRTQSSQYKTSTVKLVDGWDWSMYEHVRRSFLYKNSKFTDGANDGERPFDNIILPIINVAYRSEGFDVKDIVPYVNDEKEYHKSFLVKKYHPRWARDNDIDTFIDDVVESYVDYGLALVQEVDGVRPEVVPLEKLAFADQTDVLSGALCIEHEFTPSELKKQKRWYQDEVERAIQYVSDKAKVKGSALTSHQENQTPTGYIRVYEIHGEFPESWLDENGADDVYTRQMHIICLYDDKDKHKGGMCLYKGRSKNVFKAIKRDKIFGRACGRGGIEELFDPQVWTNYDAIQVKEMLDVASLMLTISSDKALATRQKITELEKGEMLYENDGANTRQLVLQPINKAEFDRNTEKWDIKARLIGSASDPQLGMNPASGTPLGTTQLVTSQGIGLHEYRQGKIATFIQEIYRDWVLQYLVKEINKGQKFLEELSLEEMQDVAERITTKIVNGKIKELVLRGEMLTKEESDQFRAVVKEQELKRGNKRFIETVKDEIKDIPMDVFVNVAGKQKNMAEMANKLSNIVRTFISDPRFQNQDMANLLMELLENSGLSPVNFSSLAKVFTNPQPTAQPTESPIQAEQLAPQTT